MKIMRTREEALKYLEKNFNIKDFKAPIHTHLKPWLDELDEEIGKQGDEVKKIMKILLESDRIYTAGLGRSKLAALNTGMRLLHTSYQLFEVGHPYTPAIGNDERYKDAFFAVSGSGETEYVVTEARKAKKKNVPIIVITSNEKSRLAELATEKIVTLGKKIYPKGSSVPPEHEEPINFLQGKSEDKARDIGELIINYGAKIKGITEADMKRRHAD